MKNTLTKTLPPLIIIACSFAFNQAYALAHPWEFQADARMQLQNHGPVERAYGLVYLETDGNGDGTITVMFSNASEVDLARFNAHLKFLDAGGALLGEEYFECLLDSAGLGEAIECRLSRPLAHRGFDSIEVDFYLSDVPATARVAQGLASPVAGAVGYLARQ